MKFITAQPDSNYFIWQLQVQMNNFKKFNIEKDSIILLGHDPVKGINPLAQKFADSTKAIVIFFPDLRIAESKKYIPTIRPYLLKNFYNVFDRNPIVCGHDLFYHDSDMLFLSLPNFDKLRKKNKIVVSDTLSYIGAKYIKTVDANFFIEMCKIVGIDPKIVEKNENTSGGAQYFIPNDCIIDYGFWDKVENDSYKIFNNFNGGKLQIWTSDMWSLLWNFWLKKYKTIVDKELDFLWATSLIEEKSKCKIFHNAGVTNDKKNELFFKGDYINRTPFDDDFSHLSSDYCSIIYINEIIDTKSNI